MSYREYQSKLNTISPSTRRTLEPELSKRGWYAAVMLGAFIAALFLSVLLLGAS